MNSTNVWIPIGAWLGYFILHSAFASTAAKDWVATHVPHLAPFYRLAYNAIAKKIMVESGIPINDLHAFALPKWRIPLRD